MAIDGLFLYNIQEKLNVYTPCKIGKIQNISDEEILIHLHTRNDGNQKLVINVHSNTNRVYIANFIPGIQPEPSNFVMVLRKLCSQAIVESFEQVGYDRILCLHLSCRNEFQDLVKYDLNIELMGKYANLILVKEGVIVDALKRIPVYENAKRFIHPGAKYVAPTQPEKKNPFEVQDLDLDQSLVKQIYGFSPLLSNEFLYRMNNNEKYIDILNEVVNSNTLYIYKKDFHCIELKHLNEQAKTYTIMEGLNHLYEEDEQKKRIKEQYGDIIRMVDKEKNKQIKKLPKLEQALEDGKDYHKYQEYGDLIFAYMYQIKKEKTIILPSFETNEDVTIPIDMRYDLKTNANKYYQKYHKMKRSLVILEEQINQCKEDIEYYTQLEEQLQHCSVFDAGEIREELIKQRVLMPKKENKRKKKNNKPNVLHLVFDDCEIYVGKNNIQNNYVTHQVSRKNDLWFHVKDYHGSHVLLKSDDFTETQIRLCAMLAAYYSKGKDSSSVPVDYCLISQIKKVPGSKIGFVTMKSNKTIYIDPDETYLLEIIKNHRVK